MQGILFNLPFPFTNLFWTKALSSAKQEAVTKYPTLQDKVFSYSFAPMRGHTASLTTQTLPGVLVQTPHSSLQLLLQGCGAASATGTQGETQPLGEHNTEGDEELSV